MENGLPHQRAALVRNDRLGSFTLSNCKAHHKHFFDSLKGLLQNARTRHFEGACDREIRNIPAEKQEKETDLPMKGTGLAALEMTEHFTTGPFLFGCRAGLVSIHGRLTLYYIWRFC